MILKSVMMKTTEKKASTPAKMRKLNEIFYTNDHKGAQVKSVLTNKNRYNQMNNLINHLCQEMLRISNHVKFLISKMLDME